MVAHVEVALHPAFTIGIIDPRMFGSFVEHLGRGVYGGLFEPGHPAADESGFRIDVVALVRELGVTTVRYPGGNFVSAYDWRDGIGPIEDRPRRLDPAWRSIETNAFGTDEFARWCAIAGVEPMMAVNLGTSDIRSALQLLEYVNHPSGTALSDERRANGSEAPYGISLWCLGNEMDGPWQIGHMTAAEYGRAAARAGAAMRALDPDVRLIVCGSSNDRMATFGSWEHEVLTRTVDIADYISCHQYYRNDGDLGRFLASGASMDRFIDMVAATIVQVKASTGSSRDIAISFDEWNVWDWEAHDEKAKGLEWEVAPPLLEDRYTAADAVVVADMLISMVNRADVVRAASLAQLVNVIGPIVAEPGGTAWRQSTFHPFAAIRRSAGATALRTAVSGPAYASDSADVPVVSAAAAWDPEHGVLDVHLVHRTGQDTAEVEIDLRAFGRLERSSATLLHHDDPLAANSAEEPDRVSPRRLEVGSDGGVLRLRIPPVGFVSLHAEFAR